MLVRGGKTLKLDEQLIQKLLSRDLMDFVIRVGLLVFLIVVCVKIFAPFLGLMVWALILAVTLYPAHLYLVGKTGGRQGRAATLLVLIGLLLLGGPTVMIGASLAEQMNDIMASYKNNEISIKQPGPKVAKIPVIGKKLHAAWSAAASDLPAFMEKQKPHLGQISKSFLSTAGGIVTGLLMFFASLIIAGIMMAYGQPGDAVMQKIYNRFLGPVKGPHLFKLSVMTTRSVAMGVVGVAFIQALLLGVGFIWADVPAAGILALVVLLVGILQLPALIISLPVIAYIWWGGDAGTTSNVMYTIYLLVAGAADNVLKPLLLGRGVDAPMPIILLGALGGLATTGLIGLFVGAVLLALGYKIFMAWVNEDARLAAHEESGPATDSVTATSTE